MFISTMRFKKLQQIFNIICKKNRNILSLHIRLTKFLFKSLLYLQIKYFMTIQQCSFTFQLYNKIISTFKYAMIQKEYHPCSIQKQNLDQSPMSEEYSEEDYQLEYQSQYTYTYQPTIHIYNDAAQLIQNIEEQIIYLSSLTSMPRHSLIELWQKCQFKKDKVLQLMDTQNSHWGQISYDPKKKVKIVQGECVVCYQNKQLLQTECNYTFCLGCLKQYLKVKFKTPHQSQLFPTFQLQGTKVKLNGLFVEIACQDEIINSSFDKLLCIKYARSNSITLCSRTTCQKYITTTLTSTVVTCQCGNRMCARCKKEDHFPLLCQQYKPQNNIFSGVIQPTEEQKQQIKRQLVLVPRCPGCQILIQKKGGCDHMTCRCGHSFCWKCFGEWQNNFHKCKSISEVYYQPFQIIENPDQQYLKMRDEDQFTKTLRKIQQIGYKLYHLQSDNIGRMLEELINCEVLEIDAQKLLEARNVIVNVYRLYYNLETYSFYSKSLPDFRKQLQAIKFQADRLYEEILNPNTYLYKSVLYFSRIDDRKFINDLISKIGGDERQLRNKLEKINL